MSLVYVSADWHFGHKNIHQFRSKERGFPVEFQNEAEHREWITDYAKSKLTKKDTLLLLGDICFTEEALQALGDIPCRKVLVKGNHDLVSSSRYDDVFVEVHGLYKYKRKVWLSHLPKHLSLIHISEPTRPY